MESRVLFPNEYERFPLGRMEALGLLQVSRIWVTLKFPELETT